MCSRALSARIHKAYEIKVQSDTPKRACDEEKNTSQNRLLNIMHSVSNRGNEKMNTQKNKGTPRGVPEKINILPVCDTRHKPEPQKKRGKSAAKHTAVKGVPEKINYYTPVPPKPREIEPGEITTMSPVKWWRAYKAGKAEAKQLTIDEIKEKYHLHDFGGPFSRDGLIDLKEKGTFPINRYKVFAVLDIPLLPWIKLKKHPRAYKIVKYSAVGALVGISFISIALVVGIIFCIFFLLYIAKL